MKPGDASRAHRVLLAELRRLIGELRADRNITNSDGVTNYIVPRFACRGRAAR
jgi:hypothetical protein